MLKTLANSVFSFDVEWIPDPRSAEILHNLPAANNPGSQASHSFEVLGECQKGEAPDSQPYLKTILCRVVSLAGIPGKKSWATIAQIISTVDPSDSKSDEKTILSVS